MDNRHPPQRIEESRIRIAQHNMQHSRVVLDEMNELMHSRGIDVLLAQEPYCYKGTLPGMGLATRIVAEGDPVMAAVAVKNPGLSVLKIAHLCDTHLSCVCISGAFGDVYLIAQYFQYSEEIDRSLEKLERVLVALRHKRVIIAADVNAKSPVWGGVRLDARGVKLEEFLAQHGLVVLNEVGSAPTYSSISGESWIDATFATPDMVNYVRDWKVQRDWTSSDHRVIEFVLQFTDVSENRGWQPRFRTSHANWDHFDRALLGCVDRLNRGTEDRADVEHLAQEVERSILNACNASMRPKQWHRKSVPWWTAELTRRKKHVHRMRRAFQRENNPQERAARLSDYRVVRRAYTVAVRAAKFQSWKDFVTEQGNENPWGLVYKIARKKLSVETAVSNIRTPEGYTLDWKTTASRLLGALIPDDSSEGETRDQARLRRDSVTPPATEDCRVFTRREVGKAIGSLKRGKCPGPDRVEADVVKRAYGSIHSGLLRLYNGCLTQGVFPVNWKIGSIRTILKGPEKPETDVKSYRPICLLSILGKVLEKLMILRLNELFLNPEYCSDRQFGFRPGRSTTDALVLLRDLISDREEKYILGLSFDISGAFDNVWWPSILDKLKSRGCPRNLYQLMVDYFSGRVVTIVSRHGIVQKNVTKGCPQGSILGPSCWNLVFDQLLHLLTNIGFCEPIAYADDLLVIIYGNSRLELQRKGQIVADTISGWCASQKLELSAAKTEMVLLKGSLDRERPPVVKIGQRSVNFKQTIRYLGVHIDRGMGIKSHVSILSAKSTRTFYAFTRLAKSKWGLGHRAMNVLYKGLFVPIVTYAAAGWADLLGVATGNILARAQRRVLLGVTRAYRTISTDALAVIAGTIPVDLVIADRALAYNARRQRPISLGDIQISSEDLVSGLVSQSEVRARVREKLLQIWQMRWSSSEKGRLTFRYFPDVSDRLNTRWVVLDHYVVQFLSGHGNFRAKLRQFARTENPNCNCGAVETPDHVLFECPRYPDARELLRRAAEDAELEWPVSEAQLVSNEHLYREFRRFAREVLVRKENRTPRTT